MPLRLSDAPQDAIDEARYYWPSAVYSMNRDVVRGTSVWAVVLHAPDGPTHYLSAETLEPLCRCCVVAGQCLNGRHLWVAGMVYVDDEDLTSVARMRARNGERVECERCEVVYSEE